MNYDIKSYNIRYWFNTKQGKIESVITIFATNKQEVDIIIHNVYTRIVKGGKWKIDGVFAKTKECEQEGKGKFKYLN